MHADITILWVNLGTFLIGLLCMPSDTLASYKCTTVNISTRAGQQLLGDAWAYGIWHMALTLALTAAYRLANNRSKNSTPAGRLVLH